jgi:hypothetical protein
LTNELAERDGDRACTDAESKVDLVDEMVFADVERLRPRLAGALGAGVSVAAPQ